MADDTPTVVTVSAISAPMGTGSGATLDGHPVIFKVLQPLTVILVRALRVFFQTLVGLVTAGVTAPKALPAKDFIHLVILCASLSLAPVFFCIVQNMIELLGQFDQSHPTLTA